MLFLATFLLLGTISKADYNSYNSKTSYLWVYDNSTSAKTDQWTTFKLGSKTCNAIHVSGIFRHGARWPGHKQMKKMTPLQNKLLQYIPNIENSPYKFLKTWKNLYPLDKEKELITLGAQEMEAIGGRFGTRMQDFLDNKMNHLLFISSEKQRSEKSAKEFYKGLSKAVTGQDYELTMLATNNSLLRYYRDCDRIDTIINSKGFLKEYDDFLNGRFFKNTTDSIVERLGLVGATLEKDEVELLYQMCPYERTCFSRDDWCSMLSDDEKDIMGYAIDLQTYYEEAHGHPLQAKNSCPLMQHVFKGMDEAIKWNSQSRGYVAGIFRFGHSETLIPIFAALGMFKDDFPLRADNYEAMKNRKFNTTNMIPFSANLEFVLYECNKGMLSGRKSHVSSAGEHYLKLFHNEVEVEIPGCSDFPCKYKDVRAMHVDLIDNCQRDRLCKEPVGST